MIWIPFCFVSCAFDFPLLLSLLHAQPSLMLWTLWGGGRTRLSPWEPTTPVWVVESEEKQAGEIVRAGDNVVVGQETAGGETCYSCYIGK